MSYNHLRANVRNLLVGATLPEMRTFLAGAAERGEAQVVEYAEEFIREVEAENADCIDPAECSGDHYPLGCTD